MLKDRLIKILIFLALAGMLPACTGLPVNATPTPVVEEVIKTSPTISATGKVVPADLSHLSMSAPGIVQEIMVKKGDEVDAGDVLMRLKGREDLQAAIAKAEFELETAVKRRDDLKRNVDITGAAAEQRIADATKAVRDAQYQLDNFTVPMPQSKMTTDEALVEMGKLLDIARAAFEPYKYYPSTDQTRKDRKEDLDDAQADFNSAVKRLQYETELSVANARLAQAKRDYESWKDGPDPAELRVAEAGVTTAQAAVEAARAQLDDLELKAPFSGTIGDISIHIGEWVSPGQPVLLIADLGHLQIETTDLNEIDAARVKVGDAVKITFDALPGTEVQGTIKSIAPKSSEGSGVNYTVVILMEKIPLSLRWGMTAFTDIQVD